jgi:hypothetical protein
MGGCRPVTSGLQHDTLHSRAWTVPPPVRSTRTPERSATTVAKHPHRLKPSAPRWIWPLDTRPLSTLEGGASPYNPVVRVRSRVLAATVFSTVALLPGAAAVASRLPRPPMSSGSGAAILRSGVPTSTTCPVTSPSGRVPPAVARMNLGTILTYSQSGWFGNGQLWVNLPAHSVLYAQTLPRSRLLQVKFGWFRAVPGQVRVQAHTRAGATARFNADIGTVAEYGPTGFVPSVLQFARPGCWDLTASLGRTSLTFVVRVATPASAA